MKHKDPNKLDIKMERGLASAEVQISGGETFVLRFSYDNERKIFTYTLHTRGSNFPEVILRFPIDWSGDFSANIFAHASCLIAKGISTETVLYFLTISLAKIRVPQKIRGRVEADFEMLSAMYKDAHFMEKFCAQHQIRIRVNDRLGEPDRKICEEAEKLWHQAFREIKYPNTKTEPWLDHAEMNHLEYVVNLCVALSREAARRQRMSAHERIEELSRRSWRP